MAEDDGVYTVWLDFDEGEVALSLDTRAFTAALKRMAATTRAAAASFQRFAHLAHNILLVDPNMVSSDPALD